jgi:hypothetical protein
MTGDSPILPPRESESSSPQALAAAKERGTRAAAHDIQRGTVRILDYGMPLPSNSGHRTDRITGYPLESIAGCVVTERFTTEVEAYNDAMRTWQTKHKR